MAEPLRWLPALAGLAALALVLALHGLAPGAYAALLAAFNIPPAAAPFSDLSPVLQAVRCAGQGVNVYVPNGCMGGGVYNYSPLLLHLHGLPGAAAAVPGGLALALLYLLAQAALPAPRGRAELAARLLALLSGASLFAVERANLDLLIFCATVFGIALYGRGPPARALGLALFGAGAALKYYPVSLFLLALRERRAVVLALFAAGLLLIAAAWWRLGPGILASLAIIPHGGAFGDCFGGLDLPYGVFQLWAAAHGVPAAQLPGLALPKAGWAAYALLGLLALAAAGRRVGLYQPALVRLPAPRLLLLAGGAALVCFCFCIAQNIMYRAVFLTLLIPGLAALSARRLLVAVLLLMWEELFRYTNGGVAALLGGGVLTYTLVLLFWLAREALWWWVITQLLAILLAFIRQSPVWPPLRRRPA